MSSKKLTEFGVPPGGPTPLRPLTVENRCCGFPRLPKPQYIFLCQQMSKDLHCSSERKYTLPLLCVCVHLCISIVLFICVFVYFMCVLQFTFKCQEIRNIATLQCCSGRKDTLRLLYRPKNCLCHCYCFCYFDCYLQCCSKRKDTLRLISSNVSSSPPSSSL